jgi:hypothetical protein
MMSDGEPTEWDVYLDSDYLNYGWQSDTSFDVYDGFNSGCVGVRMEDLPNPAAVMEDGNSLGYFSWVVNNYDGLTFTKVDSQPSNQ